MQCFCLFSLLLCDDCEVSSLLSIQFDLLPWLVFWTHYSLSSRYWHERVKQSKWNCNVVESWFCRDLWCYNLKTLCGNWNCRFCEQCSAAKWKGKKSMNTLCVCAIKCDFNYFADNSVVRGYCAVFMTKNCARQDLKNSIIIFRIYECYKWHYYLHRLHACNRVYILNKWDWKKFQFTGITVLS